MTVHRFSRVEARRIAVRPQLLDRRGPPALVDLVCHLTLLQIDPTAAIAPNADLVAWSRIGSSYTPAELETALEERALLELRAMIRPSEHLCSTVQTWLSGPGAGPGAIGRTLGPTG